MDKAWIGQSKPRLALHKNRCAITDHVQPPDRHPTSALLNWLISVSDIIESINTLYKQTLILSQTLMYLQWFGRAM